MGAYFAGDPIALREAAAERLDLANAIENPFDSRQRQCRLYLAWAKMWRGDLTGAIAQFRQLAAEADAGADVASKTMALISQAQALAYRGDTSAARAAGSEAIQAAAELGGIYEGTSYGVMTCAALASGDVAGAADASQAGWPYISLQPDQAGTHGALMAQVALARGDLITARRFTDDAVNATNGWHKNVALTTRARVAIAQGQPGQAERDAHVALACGVDVQAYLGIPDTMDCLAGLAAETGSHPEAARLFASAAAMRQRTGEVRFQIYQADYDASVAALRNAMGEDSFESAWAEGAALSTEEAITYAQRGRGERKRPTIGWASLTPTERDVVRLVSEGLSNKDIGARLFVSPRTVQTHLTHIYTKLGLTSRMQLAHEAARRA